MSKGFRGYFGGTGECGLEGGIEIWFGAFATQPYLDDSSPGPPPTTPSAPLLQRVHTRSFQFVMFFDGGLKPQPPNLCGGERCAIILDMIFFDQDGVLIVVFVTQGLVQLLFCSFVLVVEQVPEN
eukprot:gene6644-biopygen13778